MDVLSDCCPGIACVRHIPGGDSYLCASGTGSLAHSTDPGNWRHSFPPVAVNLFAAASVSKLKMGDIAKGELPFFLGYTAVFFLIVFVPALSTLLL